MSETLKEYAERCKRQAMRDHPFTPGEDPRYCGHWSGSSRTGEFGTLTFSAQCGYPPDLHPVEETHYGEGPAGSTLHKGRKEDCPGPDCGPSPLRDNSGRFARRD